MAYGSDPSNANLSFIATTGGTWSNIVDWEANTQGDLVAAAAGEVACVRDETTTASACTVSGATTNGTYYRRIRAELAGDSGGSGSDKGFIENGPGALYYNSSYAACESTGTYNAVLIVSETYCQVEGVQLKSTTNRQCLDQGSGGTTLLANLICWLDNNNGSLAATFIADSYVEPMVNVVAYSEGKVTDGIHLSWGADAINCSVFGDGNADHVEGYDEVAGTCAVYNCWSEWDDGSSAAYDTALGGDYNAGHDTTAPGANSVDSVDFDSPGTSNIVNPASDFSPVASGALDGAGDIRSGYEDDIWGTSRGTAGNACEIGVAEIIAAGGNPKGVFGLPFHGPFGGPI